MATYDDHLKALQELAEERGGLSTWSTIEHHSRAIADSLRGPDAASKRVILGEADIQVSLAKLLRPAFPDKTELPKPSMLPAVYQILRVLANFCADSDTNRSKILDDDIPSLVLKGLRAYCVYCSTESFAADILIDHLQVMKTSLGVLINASIGFQPIASALLSEDAPLLVIELSSKIYPSNKTKFNVQEWGLRQGITSWAWKTLIAIRDCHEDDNASILDHRSLPYLTKHLTICIDRKELNEFQGLNHDSLDSEMALTELEALEESAMALEGLALDSETARLALASHDLMNQLLDFIEFGNYPNSWSKVPMSERQSREKIFEISKGALIKAVVAVAGETRNSDVLWNSKREDAQTAISRPSSWFAVRMLQWVSAHSESVKGDKEARDDLVICGTLCLGNLARDDTRAINLAQGEVMILPNLLDLLQAHVDIKVKNGAVGLLKNLSQPLVNRQFLGERGIIEALTSSGIWSDANDMAEVVQGFGIGVCKHLANGNVRNSLKIASAQEDRGSALEQILALVKRSDAVAIKSEGTRVLVNIIKSIFSSTGNSISDDPRLQDVVKLVTEPEYSSRLAEMLVRSQKYPLLINESLVSMTLVAAKSNGEGVLKALTESRAGHLSRPSVDERVVATRGSEQGFQPASHVIVEILNDLEHKFPPEIKANTCSLITAVASVSAHGSCSDHRALFKQTVQQTLEEAAAREKASPNPNQTVRDALNRAIKAL